jgi:signal transduction histidine kinase
MSFSARLLLTSLVTLAVGLGALVVAGNVLLDRRVNSEISNMLDVNAEAQLATLAIGRDGISVRDAPNDEALDRHSWVLAGDRVVERATNVSSALDREAVALGRARAFGDHNSIDEIRFRVVPIVEPGSRAPAGAVVVAQSTAPLENLQRQVLLGSVVVAALVLLAGAIALRMAIIRALEPVVQMTSRAEAWGAHDLDGRFDLGPPRDELTGLAATLDGLLDRIAASRRHEQRFASEVAHELRTPVAGLRGRAELALDATGPEAEARREAALRAVVAQSARLTDTVDTLLAVARRELDPTSGAVDLAALAREIEQVDVVGPDDLPLAEGEPEVLRRALAPLVANARRHAREQVTLELSSGHGRVRVAVRDDGPGMDPAIGERAFVAGVRGAGELGPGAGLGLPLARRLARSCGGDVLIGDGPGGNFVLELPAVRSA